MRLSLSNFKKKLLIISSFYTFIRLNFNPKYAANKIYEKRMQGKLDWDNPKTYIEKIYWMQVYTNTNQWTLCADKFRVREYLTSNKCEHLLNELLGCWERAEDIEWEKLPESFVLKPNNACGRILYVNDKNELNLTETIKTLNAWVSGRYGIKDGQFHYSKIKPLIIAEKHLNRNNSVGLIDYKFFCFNGVPESIIVIYNRANGTSQLSLYDLEWNNITEGRIKESSIRYGGIDIPKPVCLDEMIHSAKILSEGFPHVRVDFYEVSGRCIFGELTFTPGYGSLTASYYEHLGNLINISNSEILDKPNRPCFG